MMGYRFLVRSFPVLVLFASSATAQQDPFLGRWKLDLAKSKLSGQIIEIRELPGTEAGYSFKEDEHIDLIVADGLDHPTHFGETMAISKKAKDIWSITYKRENQILMNTTWKVSRDGKKLTYTATGTRPNGQKFSNEMTARRTAGTLGLAGTWETTGVNLSSPLEIYIEPFGSDGHSITFPGRKQTVQMNFDGKEYVDQGPTVDPGATSSGRRINARTIETTERVKGKLIEVATATISEDGNTQTISVTEPDDKTPVVLVYRKEAK